jgi:hypothetical protein
MISLRTLGFSLLAVALLTLGGCAANPKLGGFTVLVQDIKPVNDHYVVTLNFVNENTLALACSSAKYSLDLGGKSIGSFVSKEAMGLPQLATATQTVALPATLTPAVSSALASTSGAVSYTLSSRLNFLNGEDELTVATRHQGMVTPSR